MTEDPAPVPPSPSAASVSVISLGIACCVVSVVILADCYYSIFFWLPRAVDFYNSVKAQVDLVTELMARCGRILWVVMSLCAVLSIVEARRRPGHRRTTTIQVTTCVCALVLACLARHALLSSLIGLMQGIGLQR